MPVGPFSPTIAIFIKTAHRFGQGIVALLVNAAGDARAAATQGCWLVGKKKCRALQTVHSSTMLEPIELTMFMTQD
jgi:hypothetical protein